VHEFTHCGILNDKFIFLGLIILVKIFSNSIVFIFILIISFINHLMPEIIMKNYLLIILAWVLYGTVTGQTVIELYDRAIILYGEKQYQQGVDLCTQALATEPNNKDLLNRRAYGYNFLGQFDKAIMDCDKAIQIDSLLAKAYYNRATAYYEKAVYQKAVQDYEKALSIEPKVGNAVVYSFIGYAYYKLNRFIEVEKYYDKALALNPKNPISWYYKGLAQANLNRTAEAIPNYNEAIRLNATDPVFFYRRGQAYFYTQKYNEAVADFQQCMSMDKRYQDTSTYHYLGHALLLSKQYSKSIEAIDQSIRLGSNLALNYYLNGQNKSKLGQHLAAISDYDKAIQMKVSDPFVHIMKGNSLNELERYDEAIKAFSIFIQIKPKEAPGFSNRCYSYLQINQYDKAIQDCSESLRLRPDNAPDHSNIGLAYFKTGNYLKAVQAFDACEKTGGKSFENCGGIEKIEAIRHLPEIPEADAAMIYKQGLWLIKLDQEEAAITLFDKGIKRYSQDASMYFGKYLAMKSALNFIDRDKLMETVVRLSPNKAEHQYWLGFEYFLNRRNQEAIVAFDKSMTLGGQYLVQQNKDKFGDYKQVIINQTNQVNNTQQTQQKKVDDIVISEVMKRVKSDILNGLIKNNFKIVVDGNSNTGNVQNTYRQPWADLKPGESAVFTVIIPETARVIIRHGNGNSCLTGNEKNGSGVMILNCEITNKQQSYLRYNFYLEIIGTNLPFYYVVAANSVE
jgi:tetratricopeptide (TPR) repeat protein